MTKEDLRRKAIECVSNIVKNCNETPCEYCARLEDCKQIIQTPDLLANEIWAYEHGFADGVEEGKQKALAALAENLKQEIDYLNDNGGGIGDLYFWLERIKRSGANE